MSQPNLMSLLRVTEADPTELAAVLLTHFGGSHGRGREVRYGPQDAPALLTLRYAKNGSITQVERGDGVDEADLTRLRAKIERDVLAREGVQVGRKVLFAARPLTGWFRYRDRFQLLPVPKDAPKSRHPFALNPFILETAFVRTGDSSVAIARQAAAEREIELLLSLLVGLGVSVTPRTTSLVWVLDPADPAGPSLQTQHGYGWPGLSLRADDFSAVADLLPCELEPHDETLNRRGGISMDSPLRVPEILPWLVECYFRLTPDESDRFRRAAYWYDHAHQVWSMSRSSAYMDLIRAIEAVMPPPPKRDRCRHCQAEVGDGPTTRFAAFVDSLTAGAISNAVRRKFYRVRSNLTHGTILFVHDESSAFGGPDWMLEQGELQTMSSVARAVLTNWLAQAPSAVRNTSKAGPL